MPSSFSLLAGTFKLCVPLTVSPKQRLSKAECGRAWLRWPSGEEMPSLLLGKRELVGTPGTHPPQLL